MRDQEQIYRIIVDELRNTIEAQTERKQIISRKATQIVTADLLALSIILAVSSENLSPVLLITGFFSFVVSIYYCIHIIIPIKVVIGLGGNVAQASDQENLLTFLDDLMAQYREFISENDEVIKYLNDRLEKGAWSAFAGILLFSASTVKIILDVNSPLFMDAVLALVIVILVFYGKDQAMGGSAINNDE